MRWKKSEKGRPIKKKRTGICTRVYRYDNVRVSHNEETHTSDEDDCISDNDEGDSDNDITFIPSDTIPEIRKFVLVKPREEITGQDVYYVAQVTENADAEGVVVSYSGPSFIFPTVPDENLVAMTDIASLLPDRRQAKTPRLNTFISFNFKFGNINLK